jgi:DNA repair protein RadD
VRLWEHQYRGLEELDRLYRQRKRRVIFTSPTGMGKGKVLQELVEWFEYEGLGSTIYTNRNLLREQLSQKMIDAGLCHGIRAAGQTPNFDQRIQLSSIQTEHRRVFGTDKKKPVWNIHSAGFVGVDEIHLSGGRQCQELLELHEKDGSFIVGFTATPIDLQGDWDAIVQAGTVSEGRACKALHEAKHFAINEPDCQFVRSTAAGEYEVAPGQKRTVWVKSIVGSVIENYKRLNPNRLPTILFAPGVRESIWFAHQMTAAGFRWAHIDGSECWIDGEFHSSKGVRDEIIKELREGKLLGVSNRFVLREGIDIPELHFAIVATVFGSLASYLQAMGRILRYHPSHEHVVIADHGGNYWRHGSVNEDRHWHLGTTTKALKEQRELELRQQPEQLAPLVCPRCQEVRLGGRRCPSCGHEAHGRARIVVQQNGELRLISAPVVLPLKQKVQPSTEDLWKRMYYRAKNGRMTFAQAEALFFHEHGYMPPRNLPLMPSVPLDWTRRVADVERSRLLRKSFANS